MSVNLEKKKLEDFIFEIIARKRFRDKARKRFRELEIFVLIY